MFIRLVDTVIAIGRRLLFCARKTADPESKSAIKGKDREV